MKNCKTFCKAQIAIRFMEIIQPPPSHPHQIKIYYISGTKIFLGRYIEIYKHLLSKCFKNAVLARQEMVQCKYFFWHHKHEHVCWKICKVRKVFGCVVGAYYFQCQASWSSSNEFLLALRLSARKLEVQKNSYDVWTYIKTLYGRNNIFRKEFQIWDFESLMFWSIFRFFVTALRCFCQSVFFLILVTNIFTHSPNYKKSFLQPCIIKRLFYDKNTVYSR